MKLKPCPFCGGEAYDESYGPGEWQGSVFCGDAKCAAGGFNADSYEESVARWNRRTEAPREGWVLVPREPTIRMMTAMGEVWRAHKGLAPWDAIYRAMLAAAPSRDATEG